MQTPLLQTPKNSVAKYKKTVYQKYELSFCFASLKIEQTLAYGFYF